MKSSGSSPSLGSSCAAPGFRFRLLAAFASVYFFWGSTYLAIRYAVETLPPFLMAGGRFLISGVMLYAWTRLRGTPRPERRQWLPASVVGICLLLGGNGGVVWAEGQGLPSGITALLVGVTPFWMVLLGWLAFGGPRPQARTVLGLILGFCGLAMLLGPERLTGDGHSFSLAAAGAVLFAAFSWSFGSLYSRQASLPASPLLSTAMQMLTGGVILCVTGLGLGEAGRLDLSRISAASALAFAWLVVFGSLAGFTAYIYLLRHTTPARASTYAYVNPVVAVVLGWAIAGEPLTARIALAAAVIISSVALITARPSAPAAKREEGRNEEKVAA